MAYKTILVSLNEIARLSGLNAIARRIGSAFSAHVSGLYVIPSVQFQFIAKIGTTVVARASATYNMFTRTVKPAIDSWHLL